MIAPAPPVMVSEPWPAFSVSPPAPPPITLPGKLVVEVRTTPGVATTGVVAVALLLVVAAGPPNTWAEVRPVGETPTRSAT